MCAITYCENSITSIAALFDMYVYSKDKHEIDKNVRLYLNTILFFCRWQMRGVYLPLTLLLFSCRWQIRGVYLPLTLSCFPVDGR